MNQVLQTNIFFFITALAIMVVSALLAVVLVYILRILRDIEHISQIIRKESDLIEEDIVSFRKSIQLEGALWKNFFSHLSSWILKEPKKQNGGGRKRIQKDKKQEEV